VAPEPQHVDPEQVTDGALPKVPGLFVRIVVMAALFGLYAFGQAWETRGGYSDVEATSFPAWYFVETGSWDLSPHRDFNVWFVETERGIRSNRSPGVIAVAVFGYVATAPLTDDFEEWPGTLVAVVTSWLAVLVIAATAERLKKGLWLPAVILFGLGTATWAVSAMHLWPHGPAQLAIAIAVWFLVQEKDLPAGLAFAVAVLIRPPVAVISCGLALVKARSERSWKPLVTIGIPSAVAAAFYLAYNRLLFGSWSPLASYDAVGGLGGNQDLMDWAENIVRAFVSPLHGILLWSAWITVCLWAWFSRRKDVPRWLFVTPILAGIYIVVHSGLEQASGALPYNYRYPLEAITVAAPVLIMMYPSFETTRAKQIVMGVAVISSVLLQASFVFVSRCYVDAGGVGGCWLFG
jgi:hypothetical protein